MRTPVVQQMERTECGAACLGMILGHYGRWVALDELRIQSGVSRDGSRAGNVVRAARQYGLEAEGYKVELEAVRDLPLPCVVFWAFNHFVVIEGFGRNTIHLNDPAVGRRSVTWEEFDRNFTGVVLTFSPGPDFTPGGERPSIAAGLRRRFEESRSILTFIGLVSLTMVIPGILVPNFTKLFVDYYLTKKYADWLIPILVGMGGTALFHAALTMLQHYYMLRFETRLSVGSTSALVRKLLRLPIAYFGQRSPSELAVRGSQTEGLAQLVAGNMGTAILALPSAILFGLLMMYFDWYLGCLALIFAAVNFAALAVMARTLAERNQAVVIQQAKTAAAAASGLRMISEYKASGTESLLFERITGYKARQENLNAPLQRSRLMLQAIPSAINGIATASLYVIGGERVMAGAITIGILAAFQTLLSSFMGPVQQLVGMGQQLQNAQAFMTQIDDVLSHSEGAEFSPDREEKSKGARRCVGALELQNVAFGYSPLEPALVKDVSIDAKAGEWIAIVGRTGSGKSTVGKLVTGLEMPWSGEVLIDGKPISSIPRAMLRNSTAVVDQNVVIFEGTVRDNIAMWDPTITEEAIVGAAKLACIHDFIVSRQGGYQAKLSEDGNNLSGGQRALMDIARAIAIQPSVLVLDEATAALDAVTEEKVMSNLRELGCTCIIVAHRLSTIRDADRIIVLDQGRVVEMGSHDELLAANGLYRQLTEQA
ncbi:MAG: NHLP family bacteriocin export ABC transporter peptidase/permease/ATPase subunit [Alphaproteobacteria bacterium]|nr:NHLP family bacteriocin export ABC transporter peptidase/permease/ATPase subunit [Alphaproteobacteria bacterium]